MPVPSPPSSLPDRSTLPEGLRWNEFQRYFRGHSNQVVAQHWRKYQDYQREGGKGDGTAVVPKRLRARKTSLLGLGWKKGSSVRAEAGQGAASMPAWPKKEVVTPREGSTRKPKSKCISGSYAVATKPPALHATENIASRVSGSTTGQELYVPTPMFGPDGTPMEYRRHRATAVEATVARLVESVAHAAEQKSKLRERQERKVRVHLDREVRQTVSRLIRSVEIRCHAEDREIHRAVSWLVSEVDRSAQRERRETAARTDAVTRVIKRLIRNVEVECEVCCPVCSTTVDYEGFSIRCDHCDRWVHGRCAAIDPGRAARARDVDRYYCPPCCDHAGLAVIYRGARKRMYSVRSALSSSPKRQKAAQTAHCGDN